MGHRRLHLETILRLFFTQRQHDETAFQVNDDSLPLQISKDKLLSTWANGFCVGHGQAGQDLRLGKAHDVGRWP